MANPKPAAPAKAAPAPKVAKTSAEKSAAFASAAPKRVDRIVKAIESLKKLTRASSYEWTPAQADRILSALGSSFTGLESRLKNPTAPKEKGNGFSF